MKEFKVGDRVKVVALRFRNEEGIITFVDNDRMVPYKVRLDTTGIQLWFTEDFLELISLGFEREYINGHEPNQVILDESLEEKTFEQQQHEAIAAWFKSVKPYIGGE